MRILFVVGTRPEIVKTAPVIHECEKRNIEYFVLHTGQHYSKNMSQFFLEDMELKEPNANLQIGSGSQAEQTAKALVGIEKNIIEYKPDVVLVQGDTNAVLSASLAAVKLNIHLGHIEAGLRSYDPRMPEEHNRRVTDHCSRFLFAPTERSYEILKRENVWGEVYITGNTVIDALEQRIPVALKRPNPIEFLELDQFALMTLHRAENVDSKTVLEGIINGILALDMDIVFPAHPRTVSRLEELELMEKLERIKIIEPLGYLDFLQVLSKASFILTDSGGIQEEVTAPSLNKHAFVLRTSTERPESIESGHVDLVGVNPDSFVPEIERVLKQGFSSVGKTPYGDGNAAVKIIDILEREISEMET